MDENNNFEYTNNNTNQEINKETNQEQPRYEQSRYEQPKYEQPYYEQSKPKKKMPMALKVILIAVAAGLVFGGTFYGITKATGVWDMYSDAIATIKGAVKNGQGEKKFEFHIGGNDTQEESEADEEKRTFAPQTPTTTEDKEVVEVSEHDVSGIADMCMPAIVAITSTQEYETYSWFGFGGSQTYEAEASGSGIIVGEDDDEYMIATNNHVVEGAKSLTVCFIDETTADAVVKGRDSSTDVAVIAVKKADLEKGTAGNIRIATIGDSEALKVGQGVVAIGNALGYGQSVTVGYISALNRDLTIENTSYKGLIQTDAAINPGNSGGALINMKGEVIGINSAKLASAKIEGIGYAIPVSTVYDIIDNFSNQEARDVVDSSEQGYLGIQGQTIDLQTSKQYDMPVGVYVYQIIEGVPAKDSDLKEKDIITRLDGSSVSNMEDLRELLTHYEGGETIKLTVQRLVEGEYAEREVEVELAYKRDVLAAPVEDE